MCCVSNFNHFEIEKDMKVKVASCYSNPYQPYLKKRSTCHSNAHTKADFLQSLLDLWAFMYTKCHLAMFSTIPQSLTLFLYQTNTLDKVSARVQPYIPYARSEANDATLYNATCYIDRYTLIYIVIFRGPLESSSSSPLTQESLGTCSRKWNGE